MASRDSLSMLVTLELRERVNTLSLASGRQDRRDGDRMRKRVARDEQRKRFTELLTRGENPPGENSFHMLALPSPVISRAHSGLF